MPSPETYSSNYIDFLLTLDETIFVIDELMSLNLSGDELKELVDEMFVENSHETILVMKRLVEEVFNNK